ncbi:unnamed protein product, partial [marine sediment metagenome]
FNGQDSAYTDFERRVYDDEIILTRKVLNTTVFQAEFPSPSFSSRSYPNPFDTSITIEFILKETGHVMVSVYDASGRLICVLGEETYSGGSHSVAWNGKDDQYNPVSPGFYFYHI